MKEPVATRDDGTLKRLEHIVVIHLVLEADVQVYVPDLGDEWRKLLDIAGLWSANVAFGVQRHEINFMYVSCIAAAYALANLKMEVECPWGWERGGF